MKILSTKLVIASAPTLTKQATNLIKSSVRIAKSGNKLVDEETAKLRESICLACPHWDPNAKLGLGHCRLCGCTSLKRRFAAMQCPDSPPRWLAVT